MHCDPVGSYSRHMPRSLGGSWGEGVFLWSRYPCRGHAPHGARQRACLNSFGGQPSWVGAGSSSSLLLSRLQLSDTQVYEPSMRALLGTASHFCELIVLKLRTGAREQLPLHLGDGERVPRAHGNGHVRRGFARSRRGGRCQGGRYPLHPRLF